MYLFAVIISSQMNNFTNLYNDADTGVSEEVQFNGTKPAKAIPLPEFTAQNHDGSHRDRNSLMGKATVLWFYPMTGTPG